MQFVQRFLEQELESLKKDPDRVVTIVALERKLETELMLATKAGVQTHQFARRCRSYRSS